MSDGTDRLPAPSTIWDIPEYRGLLSWVTSVDHKQIGIMYLLTAGLFFLAGLTEALIMRTQLIRPNNHWLSPETYNQIFTMHGTTMIFLVVMPALLGFSMYFVPLMIGARDVAFPRLNAFGFWITLLGGLLLYFSFWAGGAPAAGWFAYTPLSEKAYSFSQGQDYWALALLGIGVGTVAAAINIIVTVVTLRVPGMTMRRLPLFVWMTFINSFLIILAIPALNASLVMLLADRQLNALFFIPQAGASELLWQHYFWFFGHPEVYIMILPGFGMISEVIPVFARKTIYGYGFMAASTVAIAFLSFAVWVHHMFATGLGFPIYYVFAGASMLIAVPTGVKIFNWIATMWGGRIEFSTAMLFATAFIVEFTVGGLSGVAFAAVPIDWQLTDTYFVVAHFHHVLFGGGLFALFAAIYYWFPKITGRKLSEFLGKIHFWLILIGFNATFFVMHPLGLLGMPRRVFTYPDLPYLGLLNEISTFGAYIIAYAILVFIGNLLVSLASGTLAGPNPWKGWTLEWIANSPPAVGNFTSVPPVKSRRPLWDLEHPDDPDWRHEGGNSPGGEDVEIEKNKLAIVLFLLSESVFFVLLIVAYVTYHLRHGNGPTASSSLNIVKTGVFSLFLFASSYTVWRASLRFRENIRSRRALVWLAVTIALGLTFLVGQGLEYSDLLHRHITISRDLFGTTFFTLTGFHGLHVMVGLIMLASVLWMAGRSSIQTLKPVAVEAVSYYWHFVDAVWVFIFAVVYLWAFIETP